MFFICLIYDRDRLANGTISRGVPPRISLRGCSGRISNFNGYYLIRNRERGTKSLAISCRHLGNVYPYFPIVLRLGNTAPLMGERLFAHGLSTKCKCAPYAAHLEIKL